MKNNRDEKITIFRSPLTSCWDGDLDTGVEKIDDAELSEIASHGYNGIWIHQPLMDYTPSEIFPEFGRDSERYLRLLEELAERAARRDMRVYMYLLEPRALLQDDPFWKAHPDLRGQHFHQDGFDLEYYALCSSQPRVREYLYDSLLKLCSRIDMSFFCITAAEDFNTCIGKLVGSEPAKAIHCREPKGIMKNNSCPLCSKRRGPEIISELINTMHDGITAGNPDAGLIAWDWGWRKLPWENAEESIILSLNRDIIFVSDFEIGGVRTFPRRQGIYEYSLGYVGPSDSFLKLTKFAVDNGRRAGAKLQVGTTHEIASVPNLPLIRNLWKKVDAAKKNHITAAICTWNFGTFRTLNTFLFGHAFKDPGMVSWEKFLEMACDYMGLAHSTAGKLERAWQSFERALTYFPYSVPMLYYGPINYAPAYWLRPRQTEGTRMGMSCFLMEHGDDLESCFGEYSLDEIIELFSKLVRHWKEGLSCFRELEEEIDEKPERFIQEYNSACCVYHVYKSTLNVFRVFRLCRKWDEALRDAYLEICGEELQNCMELLPLLEADSRLGKHLECDGYMFDPVAVREKISTLEQLLIPVSAGKSED